MKNTKGWCEKCNDVKPERTHHCSTCKTCSLRLDHHCPWLNNCIGIGNYRFFVQLLFHAAAGSTFTLVCIFLGRKSILWYIVFGNAEVFILLHAIQAICWSIYFMYQIFIINRDLTSFDLYVNQKEGKRYTRFIQLSLNAKFYLLFGTDNIFKAILGACLKPAPLSGFEYSYETVFCDFS